MNKSKDDQKQPTLKLGLQFKNIMNQNEDICFRKQEDPANFHI